MDINPIDFFKDRKDEIHLFVWKSFLERILIHASPLPLNDYPVLKVRLLKENASDVKNITDFKIKPMPLKMSLEAMARLILKKPDGEKDSPHNLFYTQVQDKVFVLRVHWHNQTGLWFVSDWLLGERTIGWWKGTKIFMLKK